MVDTKPKELGPQPLGNGHINNSYHLERSKTMASGLFNIPCEQCKNTASLEDMYKIGEIYIQCPMCGYQYSRQALIDRKRQAEDPEHVAYFKLTKDGYPIHRSYVRKGYGAYYIEFDKGAVFGGFYKPITPKDIARFNEVISRHDVIAEKGYLTRWNEDTGQVEAVIGTIVNPFDGYETELQEQANLYTDTDSFGGDETDAIPF